MNRNDLQYLSNQRLEDARIMLREGRWSAAYYLAGYAVECALKSCVLKHLEATGFIFKDREDFKKLINKYWTHDLTSLLEVAGLKQSLDAQCGTNPLLRIHWNTAKDWNEESRYGQSSETTAKNLITAIEDGTDGVLSWLQNHWWCNWSMMATGSSTN